MLSFSSINNFQIFSKCYYNKHRKKNRRFNNIFFKRRFNEVFESIIKTKFDYILK